MDIRSAEIIAQSSARDAVTLLGLLDLSDKTNEEILSKLDELYALQAHKVVRMAQVLRYPIPN